MQTVRETDCDADTVSTRGVCVMRLQCKPNQSESKSKSRRGYAVTSHNYIYIDYV